MPTTQDLARQALTVAEASWTNSSALLCLADAHALYAEGQYGSALRRAVDSLRYSVGVYSETYQRWAEVAR